MHVGTAGARESLAALRGGAAAGTSAHRDQVHGNDLGIRPAVFTYNAGIIACGKGRLAKRAFQVFDQMQQNGLQPDVITNNAVISACGKGRMAKWALQVFTVAAEGTPAQCNLLQ